MLIEETRIKESDNPERCDAQKRSIKQDRPEKKELWKIILSGWSDMIMR